MNYIATLRDRDIFPDKAFPEVAQWTERKTVKIILKNKKGQIALVTNPVHKCYLLPGGGVDSGEDVFSAGDRECREEVRFSIDDAKEIGIIEEYRVRDGKRYESYCLIANVKDKVAEDLRTEDEQRNELMVEWHTPNEAVEIFREQEKRLKKGEIDFYNTGFNIIRDKLFFEHAIKEGNLKI